MDIRIENLTKVYGERKVLDVKSLLIKKGDLCGIIGPNGAGKSTLLNIIAGLDKQTEGRIFYGKNKTEIIPVLNMTLVFQKHYLIRTTAEKNISYPLKIRGWDKERIRERTDELIKEMGLSGVRKQKSWTLSGGESQKVALCRALSFRPRLLLLDEPTANIDPSTTAELERMLMQINKNEGTTILIITHNLAQAKRLCDRVVFLNKGKLEEAGLTNDLFGSPENPLTRRFIDGELLL
jgi:tungstate transport system ATP-binding protein